MATDQERLSAVELQVGKLTESAQAAGQNVPDFGPVGSTGDGANMVPGSPVAPSGTQLPWNAQAGEGGRLTFQGDSKYVMTPSPGFSGWREVSVSQTPPSYESFKVYLGTDQQPSYEFTNSGLFKVYFDQGQPREVRIVPYVPPEFGYVGAGHIQMIGGEETGRVK